MYHRAAPVGLAQNMSVRVYRVDKKKVVVDAPLPLRQGKKLAWLGYSDNGELFALDSGGLLMSLARTFEWQWVPMLDTATNPTLKSRGATHWPIGVLHGRLTCIVLKNGANQNNNNKNNSPDAQYPSTSPKPVPTTLSLVVPLAELGTQAGSLEAQHLRHELDLAAMLRASENEITPAVQSKIVAMEGVALQLFHAACKTKRLVRALDVAMKLKLRRSYQIAVTLAQKAQQQALATRINVTMRVKFGDDGDQNAKKVSVEEQSDSSSDEEEVRRG